MTESILNRVENATEEELFDLSDDVLRSVKELIAIGEFAQAFEIANAYIDSNEWPAYYEPMSYFEDHAKVVFLQLRFSESKLVIGEIRQLHLYLLPHHALQRQPQAFD